MGKSTRKGKGKALPQTVEEPLQSIPETPQEEKAQSTWGVPAIDPNADNGGGWGGNEHDDGGGWGGGGGGGEGGEEGIPGGWDEPAEHPHSASPISENTPRTLAVSPRSYASAKLDPHPPSVKDYALQQPPMGLQQPPTGLQQPPQMGPPPVDWGYPVKPPNIPSAPPPAQTRPSRQSSKNSKRAQTQAPRQSYKAPAYTTQPAYHPPAPAPAAYGAAPAPTAGAGRAGFGSWQNWAAEVGMGPPAPTHQHQQQQPHVKFASHSTHIPSSVPSATMQQAQYGVRSAWKTSGAGAKYGQQQQQAPAAAAANNGWGGAGGWDTQGQGGGWGAQDQNQGWGAQEQSGWDNEDDAGGWGQRDDEWGEEGWDEGGGEQWDNGGWDTGHDTGGWGQAQGQEEDWQDWGAADTGKGWADATPAPATAPPQGGHNDGWMNWGKNGGIPAWGGGGQRTSQQQYWSPTPAGLDDRPISHTMAYATGSPHKLKHKHRHSSLPDPTRHSITIPPGWTLANKGMDLYKGNKFKLAREGEILVELDRPLFNRDRLAKERLRWLFPPDKDKRVGVTLRWIKDVEHGLGAFALDLYLERHERGALVINAATFNPPAPVFDWLSYADACETLDKRIQESIVTYDPTKHAIIMVFLPSPSGNSAAVWRRRVEVPGSARKNRKGEMKEGKVVVEKTVFVDELTKPEERKREKKLMKKKKGFWKRLFGGVKIVW